jgi:Transposase DDE domain group 1
LALALVLHLGGCLSQTSTRDVAYLDPLYRARGRADQRYCDAKDTGLANLPSLGFATNAAWLALVLIAADLLAWTRLLCLEDKLAHVEPNRLRYCLWHTAVSCTAGAEPGCGSPSPGRGRVNLPPPSGDYAPRHCCAYRSRRGPPLTANGSIEPGQSTTSAPIRANARHGQFDHDDNSHLPRPLTSRGRYSTA